MLSVVDGEMGSVMRSNYELYIANSEGIMEVPKAIVLHKLMDSAIQLLLNYN